MIALAVASFFLAVTPADTVRMAAPSDTVRTAVLADDAPIHIRPVLPLSALYSGTFGVGLGAGASIENVGWEGTEAQATAFGALYGYGADVTLTSGDPYGQPVYGLVRGEISRATRRRFYGVGPFSDKGDRIDLDHTSATAEVRVGGYPLLTTALIVQPSVRLLVDRLATLEPNAVVEVNQLAPASRTAVLPLVGETRSGVSLGLEVASDRLDWHDYPSSGTFASVEARRFFAIDGSGLRFTRAAGSVSGYLPVQGRTVLIGHALGIVTRQDDAAVLPFPYLPTLDNDLLLAYATDRFRGRDALALGLGVRLPVANVFGVFGIDAHVTGTVGSVYDDVFRQFDPSVSFTTPTASNPGAPLRPAASLGLGFVNLENRSMYVGGRLGVSPEGISLALVSLSADLRDVVPLFR